MKIIFIFGACLASLISEDFDLDSLRIIKQGYVSEQIAASFVALFSLKQFREIIFVENETSPLRNLLKQAFCEKNLQKKSTIIETFIKNEIFGLSFLMNYSDMNTYLTLFLVKLEIEQKLVEGILNPIKLLQTPESDAENPFFSRLTKINMNTGEIMTEERLCMIEARELVNNVQSILNSHEKLYNESMSTRNEYFQDYHSNHLLINLTQQDWTSRWNGSEILENVTIYNKKYKLKVLVSRHRTGDFFVYVKHENKVLRIVGDDISEHDILENIEGRTKCAIYELEDNIKAKKK